MTERIGYIGLGITGRGMAHNLLKAGFPLKVSHPANNTPANAMPATARQPRHNSATPRIARPLNSPLRIVATVP